MEGLSSSDLLPGEGLLPFTWGGVVTLPGIVRGRNLFEPGALVHHETRGGHIAISDGLHLSKEGGMQCLVLETTGHGNPMMAIKGV